MPEFFGELVRERYLYEVLHALAEACGERARYYRLDVRPGEDATMQTMREEEAEFFEDAETAILFAVESLESDWEGRAPCAADGDVWRVFGRMCQLNSIHMKELADKAYDPELPEEERKQLQAEIIAQCADAVWTSTETGQPNFELQKGFKELQEEMSSPEITDERKAEITDIFRYFVTHHVGPRNTSAPHG